MDASEKRHRIEEANGAGRCPNCGHTLGPGRRVGSGSHSDGVFCSLDCQATFHQDYYVERARASNPSEN